MRGLLLVGLLAITAPAHAATVALTEFCGLNNSADPTSIKDCEAQDLLNVEISKTGALRKRDGYAEHLAVSSVTAQVDSLFGLKNSQGNECVIAVVAGDIKRSVNQAAFEHVSTVTVGARLTCSNAEGMGYCFSSSNDVPITYDCITYTRGFGQDYPNGKFGDFTQDRQLVAGTTDFPNRLYISESGDYDDFRTGTTVESAWVEDVGTPGDKITAVRALNGRVIVWKELSVAGFNGTDQFNFPMYNISTDVGTTGPENIIVRSGVAYFKGSDNEFYAIDGSPGGIRKLSVNISSTTASLLSGKNRYSIQTEQADFNAGNLTAAGPGAPLRANIIVGSVMGATVTFNDTSQTDWIAGTTGTVIGVYDSSGSITMSSHTFKDDFADGDFTAGPAWTAAQGSWQVTASRLSPAQTGPNEIYSPSNVSTGTWTFSVKQSGTNKTARIKFMSNGNSVNSHSTDTGYYLELEVDSAGTSLGQRILRSPGGQTVCSQTDSLNSGTERTFNITRSSAGVFYLYRNGDQICTGTDTTTSSSTYISINVNTSAQEFGNFDAYGYLREATFMSRVFDTALSTPIAGPFSSTFSVTSAETFAFFDVRDSDDNNTFTDWAASSDTTRINLNKRYWQYRVRFTTHIATKTPSVQEVNLVAATTGQFNTQCIEPGPSISAWGALEAAGTATCGRFSWALATGASCSAATTFNAVSTGTTIGVAVANALRIQMTTAINSSSCTARMDSITASWTEGAVSSPTFGAYWNDGLYWSVQTATGTNNRMLKYDLLRDQWFLWDVKALPLMNLSNQLYFGDSQQTAKVYKFSNITPSRAPTSDNGANINSYWKSKEHGLGDPFVEKNLDALSLVAKKQAGSTLTTTWQVNGGDLSGTFDVALTTGSNAINYNYSVPIGQRGRFFNVQVGNNATTPWELLGIRLDFTPEEWRVITP